MYTKVTKITKYPIGLGMGNLELEEAASRCWNHIIENELPLDTWIDNSLGEEMGIFYKKPQTGLTLFKQGFIEIDGDKFKLSDSAIELLVNFPK